ncbi:MULTISPECIES: hypothetical protein [unclassified Caballeronia]|jgi:hypothetical protein|uniref:hypothetical protein n=1 Tax=unclassified Caballeronia TaxID=2646786 RepID=UPI0011803725|nr:MULTISPECIES: hypothetical protein [unclassified Caballeronia]
MADFAHPWNIAALQQIASGMLTKKILRQPYRAAQECLSNERAVSDRVLDVITQVVNIAARGVRIACGNQG